MGKVFTPPEVISNSQCDICHTREGRGYVLYFGNYKVEEESHIRTTTKTSYGESTTVILCDECINKKIRKKIYLTPLFCFLVVSISIGIGALIAALNKDQSSLLSGLSALFLVAPVFGVIYFLASGVDALKYALSSAFRQKKYLELVKTYDPARELGKTTLKESTKYNALFTPDEYDTIRVLGNRYY